ncbi:DUF5345 family protein [Paenibacillus humicola]|uniref:DUF5345 family protein n=1 Tax=Paenibacillus humicola TaxID=3110540 RepID=UPI00237C0ED8|nr:DUF5345 family protein [Paenibacillus humicola]
MKRRGGKRHDRLREGYGAADGKGSHNGDNSRPDAGEMDASMEAEFQALLGGHLRRWDERMQPPQPSLDALEQLVAGKKKAIHASLLRELLLLWTIGAVVISGLWMLLSSGVAWFAGLQAAVLAGAALFLAATAKKEKEVNPE